MATCIYMMSNKQVDQGVHFTLRRQTANWQGTSSSVIVSLDHIYMENLLSLALLIHSDYICYII
uniref:Uncharacterized protein n=1 Tax=Xenopus tropicalis TaxID=8364 RepID=A0A1B8Y9X5_XENTR